MTKEELEKEAKGKADIYVEDKYDEENDCFSLGYARFVEGYLAGAESREKRIADLEKENAELKADNDARKFAMAMSEKVEKQLREVNARLNRLSDMQDETVVDLTKTCVQRREQLTKAKELLKWFVWYFKEDYNYVPYKQKVKEAEQFISEVEK